MPKLVSLLYPFLLLYPSRIGSFVKLSPSLVLVSTMLTRVRVLPKE